ncbi:MAG TPA: helix-turn-helix domain-containing protein [Thermoleophilaceae bacterium]|jgi:cytoskeletal protein RodZ
MQAIGERLREARMRQGLDITEIEVATKIRAKYLRALENDEFAMLPGSTYVKSFLRTYAEQLGLDAHLLVEEYRAQHEPRAEGEVPAFTPPAGRAPDRRPRRPGGPPGPGMLILGGVLVLLLIFAIIGLASGGDDEGSDGSKKAAEKPRPAKKKRRAKRRPAAPAKPKSLKLKVVPSETTYVCVDDGRGTRLFEGTISTSQSFRGKRLRINLGRSSATVYANGRRVRFEPTSDAVGLSFSTSGKATPLPVGQRPCA